MIDPDNVLDALEAGPLGSAVRALSPFDRRLVLDAIAEATEFTPPAAACENCLSRDDEIRELKNDLRQAKERADTAVRALSR